MPGRPQLSRSEQKEIMHLRTSGQTIRSIAKKMSRSKNTIQNFINNPRSYRSIKRSGRIPTINASTKERIRLLAVENNLSAREIKTELSLPVTARRVQQIINSELSTSVKPELNMKNKNYNNESDESFSNECRMLPETISSDDSSSYEEESSECSEDSHLFDAFAKQFAAVKSLAEKRTEKKKYAWLGSLVASQMENINVEDQLNVSWQVQCILNKYVQMSQQNKSEESSSSTIVPSTELVKDTKN